MPSWLDVPWFDYPITRPVTLRHFNPVILVLGVVYVVFITLINIVAVGYETTSILSVAYNRSDSLWYEHFLPKAGGLPETWTCSPSTIKVTEGS